MEYKRLYSEDNKRGDVDTYNFEDEVLDGLYDDIRRLTSRCERLESALQNFAGFDSRPEMEAYIKSISGEDYGK